MASRTKRGRSESSVPAGTPLDRVLATLSDSPLTKLAAKTLLYSALNLRPEKDEKSAEESELWQHFEALLVAKLGVTFEFADLDADWSAFLSENGCESTAIRRILELICEASFKRTQVSVCEFFLSSSVAQGEQKSARVFEYQLRKPLSLLPSAAASLAQTFPSLPENDELDTSRLSLPDGRVAALMVQVLDSTEAHGWRLPKGDSVILRLPHVLELMHLIDDDKKAGMSQMLLTDMFTKMSLRSPRAMKHGET